jgi:hypothetical protein
MRTGCDDPHNPQSVRNIAMATIIRPAHTTDVRPDDGPSVLVLPAPDGLPRRPMTVAYRPHNRGFAFSTLIFAWSI